MKLIRLEVKNFCQHRERVIEFHPRLTALLGQNGSGKSNLLTAALGALTNDFSRTHGNKAENICQLAPDDEPVYVQLTFEHNGQQAIVQRGLRASRSYIRYLGAGTDDVRGDREVTANVLNFLGASLQIIREYIFVDQGAIFAPLVSKEADRSRAFQQLFGTVQAEKCWKAVGEQISAIEVSHAGASAVPVAQLDDLREDVRLLLEAVTDVQLQLSSLSHIPDGYDPDEDPDKAIIDANSERGVAEEELAAKQEQLRIVEQESAGPGEELSGFRSDMEDVLSALSVNAPKYEAAAAALQTWELRVSQQAAVKASIEISRALEEEQQTHPEPQASADFVSAVDIAEWQKETSVLDARCHKVHETLTALDPETGIVECPTCGTPVDDLEMDIEFMRNELGELQHRIAERNSTQAESAAHNIQVTRWREWRAGWEQRQKDLLAQEVAGSEFADAGPPLSDVVHAKYEAIVARHGGWETAREALRVKITDLENSLAVKATRADSSRTEITRLSKQLAKFAADDITQESAEAASRRLKQKLQDLLQKTNLQGVLTGKQEALSIAQERVADCEEAARRSSASREFALHLKQVREVFHRDNLPRIVAQQYLQLLESDMNEILVEFNSDFRVSARDGIGFDAHFSDGRVQAAPRLSGGQKVILALAFRIAVNTLFANDLGLLCLDEPTAYLDSDNISCIRIALDRLRALSEARGLQCILITHESSLGGLFDQVVTL